MGNRAHVPQVKSALFEQVTQPVEHERGQPRLGIRRCGLVSAAREPKQFTDRHAGFEAGQLGKIDQNPEHPLRLAADPKRIARPGRLLAGAEQADDGIQLVGERHRRPRHRRLAQIIS